ncbi:hypothetical protein LHYA1_G007695 [Lachnellula hyalina]|uniref:Uncharacterized protein n=1 Tax=Lachnellula hyalina TaxID=1316788 RepID=A0A8H8TXC3_9HELO|nr:uncharacterized protein LHYA1_G007695 [Lachnellula hyalina]TVY24160.1 hypothetical protein LHYA1_G007695 [Lachnellula hyalina]
MASIAAKDNESPTQPQSKTHINTLTRRPLLIHLNADTTWLLSLPIPPSQPSIRLYNHILIDPWLRGGQSDVARFFSRQWHATPSACQSIDDIESIIQAIEAAAAEDPPGLVDGELLSTRQDSHALDKSMDSIDAVIVSHEFTDHMHKDTLMEIPPQVPIFASTKAADIIRSWKRFHTVLEIPRFEGDWRKSSVSPLPEWLGISRVAYAGADMLYYHSAVMIAFSSGGQEGEAVIYTPHGISPDDVTPVAEAKPKLRTLALLHGLQDIKLGAQLNMGAHNGLKVQRLLRAGHWIGTHDEVKNGGGIVSWFLNRKMISLQEAIERDKIEREADGRGSKGTKFVSLADLRSREVENGQLVILE